MAEHRPRPPNMFKDSNHPLAGRILTGVKTTESPERRPRVSMMLPEMYIPTIEDYARQMFGEKDPVGCRVYYCESGNFNTVDDMGRPIAFIGGLFKTNDREVKAFLQYFVDLGNIKYLQLGDEDARQRLQIPDEHKRSQGSSSSPGESNEPHVQEPLRRQEPAPDTAGQGSGGSSQEDPEQPVGRATVSSTGGDGDDSSVQGREEPSREPDQENAVENPVNVENMTPLERLRAKATG